MVFIGEGRVYTAPLDTTPAHRIEISNDDWTFIGYSADIELEKDDPYADLEIADSLRLASFNNEITLKAELKPVDNQLYALYWGGKEEKTPVSKVKELLNGRA